MKLKIAELRLELEHSREDLLAGAAKRIGVSPESIHSLWVLRRSVDARRRQIGFVYTVEVLLKEAVGRKVLDNNLPGVGLINETPTLPLNRGSQSLAWPPAVIGAGQAGILLP